MMQTSEKGEMSSSNQVLPVPFTKKKKMLLIMRKGIVPPQNAAALNLSKEVNHSL
jgi:hypothetical protein